MKQVTHISEQARFTEASDLLPLNSVGVSNEGVQQYGDTPALRFAVRREQGQACAEDGAGDPVNWTDLNRSLKQAWLQRWEYLRSFAPFGFTLSVIAALLVIGLRRCDFETRMWRLELLPDAEFELPMRWIPGYVFASGMLSVPEYHLEVPAKSLPPGFLTSEYAKSLYPKLDVGESSFDAGLQKHYMRIGGWKTPMPGEAMDTLLNEVPVQGAHGWRRFPGAPDSEYNVAAVPGTDKVVYEYKPDRRYALRCNLYQVSTAIQKLPLPPPATFCTMRVPYKEFAGERSTQLEIRFKLNRLDDWKVGPSPEEWRAVAELERSVLRPYEVPVRPRPVASKPVFPWSASAPTP